MARPSTHHQAPAARAFRKFFIGLVGTFAGLMAFFSLINTWVNPLWITKAPWTSEKFAEYRQIYRQARTAKAGLASSGTWETAFLGSSRVAIALDPENPQWKSDHVVNLAMSGASLPENAAMCRYAIRCQPTLKHIILGVDLTDLTSDTDMARAAGFYESPLNEKGDVFERNLRYVTGISTFSASFRTIKSAWRHDLALYTPKGHWARNRSRGGPREIIERDSIPYALRFVRQRKASISLSPRKLDALRQCINDCIQHDIRLTILIPPNHSVYLTVYQIEKDPDPFFTIDRRAIVNEVAAANRSHPSSAPVEVWDFNDFHPVNSVPMPPPERASEKLKEWADGTHAFEPVGDVMLARIMGWPITDPVAATYGEKIDTSNIEQHFQHIRATYEAYQRDHRADWEWAKGLVRSFSSTDSESEPELPN